MNYSNMKTTFPLLVSAAVAVAIAASISEALPAHLDWALATGTDLVIGTTGWELPALAARVEGRIGVLVAQAFPTVLEYQAALKAANKASAGNTVPEVRRIFDNAATIDDIRSITGNDLGMDSLDPSSVSCDPGNNCARGTD